MNRKSVILAAGTLMVALMLVAGGKITIDEFEKFVVSSSGNSVTFYSKGETVYYKGSKYNESLYYVRILAPEYYYNGTLFANSSAFMLEFPLGWEKLVKIYLDPSYVCTSNRTTENHLYVTSASSSATSLKLSPEIVNGCKYCLQVLFYKTTTATGDKKSYTFIEYIFDSCDPESYDFVQIAKYGNITKTKLNLVFT